MCNGTAVFQGMQNTSLGVHKHGNPVQWNLHYPLWSHEYE